MYTIKTFAYGSTEYQQALVLRDKVLRQPLGLKFTEAELMKDEHDIHMGLFDGNVILACLILTLQPEGKIKMRQVAVNESKQGQGLGQMLSLEVEKYAKEHGYTLIYCHARKVAASFYQKLGYSIVGNEFTEVNIPHYLMEKSVS
jgi:predicted GNAT family N-acyltransferase